MNISYRVKPPLSLQDLGPLFRAAWQSELTTAYERVLEHSLSYVCAYEGDHLIGFVNLAWDGGVHAFLLDTTVHPEVQRRGVGQSLVGHGVKEAERGGCHWLHVDYEAELEPFYAACGFQPTRAGLIRLG